MRDPEDIFKIKATVVFNVTLDLERIEQDDSILWSLVSAGFDLSDPEQRKEAIYKYLGQYVARQSLFTDCPATNGPGEIVWIDRMEAYLDEHQSSDARDPEEPSVHTEDQGGLRG